MQLKVLINILIRGESLPVQKHLQTPYRDVTSPQAVIVELLRALLQDGGAEEDV